MNTTLAEKIEALHAGPTMVYIAVTGAGAGIQNLLTHVPGASNTILECILPYSNDALVAFLGETPTQFASEETALKMAAKAWRKGTELAWKRRTDPAHVVGLGLTAVVGTNRALRGKHRVFIALRTNKNFFVVSVEFEKRPDGFSLIGRENECIVCDLMALNLILIAAGISQEPFENRGLTGDIIRRYVDKALVTPRILIPGDGVSVLPIEDAVYLPDGQKVSVEYLSSDRHVFFHGSFNPLHAAHEQIAKEVEMRTGKRVVYVLTVNHPNKGVLDQEEIKRRAAQFEWLAPVMVAKDAALYIETAAAFPGFSFILGADTLVRLIDPKYYDCSVDEILWQFAKLGTHFFVAGRGVGSEPAPIAAILEQIPVVHRKLFTELSARHDASSTAVRSLSA